MKFLNVGGTAKGRNMSKRYEGWEHVILDIVPGEGVDIVCDARALWKREDLYHTFDAVYCSHMIEHVDAWFANEVIAGIYNVLKPEGFAEFRTPNLITCAETLIKTGNIDSVAYVADAGPVTVRDLIYGYPGHIVGNEFQRHLTGYTPQNLGEAIGKCFPHVIVGIGQYEIRAFAYKIKPENVTVEDLFRLD